MPSPEILVCSNLSMDDTNLVSRARQLAKRIHAGITVLHAMDPMKFPMIEGNSDLLNQIKPHIRETLDKIAGIESESVRLLLEEGHPATVIPSAVDRLGINLIVMGIHGHGYIDDEPIGANVSQVIRETRCNTLIVKRQAEQMYQRVLVPVDFSSASLRSLQAARDLAPEAHFYVQHTCEIAYEGILYRSGTDRELIVENRLREREEAMEKIRKIAEQFGMSQDSYTSLVNHGHPRARIIKVENDFECDLIALGKCGQSLLQNYLLGSVAEYVLSESTADVLLVS